MLVVVDGEGVTGGAMRRLMSAVSRATTMAMPKGMAMILLSSEREESQEEEITHLQAFFFMNVFARLMRLVASW